MDLQGMSVYIEDNTDPRNPNPINIKIYSRICNYDPNKSDKSFKLLSIYLY